MHLSWRPRERGTAERLVDQAAHYRVLPFTCTDNENPARR